MKGWANFAASLSSTNVELAYRIDLLARATLEERTNDIRAVMDATGIERASIFGQSEGGSMALMFAAMYPTRVRSVIL